MKAKKKTKVIVAMSGGVDSSVAAALLKRANFDVVGVHMKCWSAEDPFGKNCTATDDERMARLAAEKIGIHLYTFNLVKEYKKCVVEYLISGYRKGITPNPDVMCNREIKFGLFFEKAMKLGADYVATGHYARLQREFPDKFQISSSKFQPFLLQAKDKEKDQSYFLSLIKPEVLSQVLFPVGEYTKPQVRALAKKFGLPNAERKDSQGICFVGEVAMEDFLRVYIPPKAGLIVNTLGEILGTHEGAWYYTIGQRRGIQLAGGPHYVAGKDMEGNILIVSKDEQDLYAKEVHVRDINWFFQPPERAIRVMVKLRYRQEDTAARLEREGEDCWKLSFEEPQRAPTPGQFAVFYEGDVVLGGGVIQNSFSLPTPIVPRQELPLGTR